MVNLFIGLLCAALGSTYSFFGYPLSRLLLPLLAFTTGLSLILLVLGHSLIENLLGFVFGATLAWLAYYFLSVRRIVAGIAMAISIFTTLMATLGFSREAILVVVLGTSVILGAVALLSFMSRYIIIGATALAGASIITTGILFLLPDLIPPGSVSVGQVLIAFRQFPMVVFLLWLPITASGLFFNTAASKNPKV